MEQRYLCQLELDSSVDDGIKMIKKKNQDITFHSKQQACKYDATETSMMKGRTRWLKAAGLERRWMDGVYQLV